MKNRAAIFFLGLCPIIPASAHLAEGLILAGEFLFLFITSILYNTVRIRLKVSHFAYFFHYTSIIIATAFYHALLQMCFPLLIFQLSLYIYISAFSYILIKSVDNYYQHNRAYDIPLLYAILIIAASAIRELFAFGTLSLPAPSGLLSIQIIPLPLPLRFFGSSAGMLIMLGIGLWLFRNFEERTTLLFQE